MNIIIPLCGKGERFQKTHNQPKPLIKVLEKEIIFYILDCLNPNNNENDIYIIINKNTNQSNIKINILKKYPNIRFIDLVENTDGASQTVKMGIDHISHFKYNNLLIVDGDNFYTQDITKLINVNENSVLYFNDENELPLYSYIQFNQKKQIEEIIEKIKISNYANTGAYYFSNINDFQTNCIEIINNNIKSKNEFYVSTVIQHMLNKKQIFRAIEIPKYSYMSLGTPDLVNQYLNSTNAFLFDLDGTLVITDHIYVNAWCHILEKYNIHVDDEFFKLYIQGNNDSFVINKLLPNLDINIQEISQQKDSYFINHLNEIKGVEGAINFLKEIKSKGHKLAVVTNCNRLMAEKILDFIGATEYIDCLIIGNECEKPKPYSDPYIKCISHFEIDQKKCFIFEDSSTGILSAQGAFPKLVIGVNQFNNENMFKDNGVEMIIKDFSDNDLLSKLLSYQNIQDDYDHIKLKKYIKSSLKSMLEIRDINILDNKLKGGYISDVIKVEIILNNNIVLNTIFKKENKNDNNISRMAKKLDLYEREYYFYESISNYVNINIPKFYGIVRDEQFNKLGIILEDLNNFDFKLNLDLNKANIDIILVYISEISKLHVQFANQNLIQKFHGLYRHNSTNLNNEFVCQFVNEKFSLFLDRWKFLLDDHLITILTTIVKKYHLIQNQLSQGFLTLCHGDLKSPNIFCKIKDNAYQPYLIDWQYICEGKGIQDIIFFMIESFESHVIKDHFNIIIDYYYSKVKNNQYDRNQYVNDITYSICYFPMFVAIWFGTINKDHLIDRNFPFIFIKKFLFFLRNYVNKDVLEKLN